MPPPVHADFWGPGIQDQTEAQSPTGHQSQGCLQAIHRGNATLRNSCHTSITS